MSPELAWSTNGQQPPSPNQHEDNNGTQVILRAKKANYIAEI